MQIIVLIDERLAISGQLQRKAENLRFRYPADRGNVIKIVLYGSRLNLREVFEQEMGAKLTFDGKTVFAAFNMGKISVESRRNEISMSERSSGPGNVTENEKLSN